MFPVQTDLIIKFVAYLFLERLSMPTIRTYLSAISSAHRVRSINDNISDSLVHILLAGVKKLSVNGKQRKPIDLCLLKYWIS